MLAAADRALARLTADDAVPNVRAASSSVRSMCTAPIWGREGYTALIRELHDIIEADHYPFSPPIRTLRAILNKLRPEPVRAMPPPKVYAPPSKRRYRS
jgi:hypothetical protein